MGIKKFYEQTNLTIEVEMGILRDRKKGSGDMGRGDLLKTDNESFA